MRSRALVPALLAVLLGCGRDDGLEASRSIGSPARGRVALETYGCGGCHTIAGVPGARGRVGPDLGGLAERVYVAGVLTQTPEHVVRWIRDPREVDPRTAMPDLGVGERDARDMTAYLYTLP